MDGARSYARILLALDAELLATAAECNDIDVVMAWLAGYREDPVVSKALGRLLNAINGTRH